MTTWPSSLPQFPLAGHWEETLEDNVIEYQPEVGPPTSRRRSTAVGSTSSASFGFTDAQRTTFESFFRDDIKDGALSFTWDHPVTFVEYDWLIKSIKFTHVGPGLHVMACELRRLP